MVNEVADRSIKKCHNNIYMIFNVYFLEEPFFLCFKFYIYIYIYDF